MGRHGQPDGVSRARTTAFRAAAAVGVAGTLAFAVQSVGKDMTVQAHSDTPYKPTVDPSSGDSHTSAATHHKHDSGTTKKPGNGDLAVSFSAKPKVLTTAGGSTGKKAAGSVSKGHSTAQSSSHSTPDPASSSPQGGGGQGSGSGSGQSTPPPSTQSPPPDSGSGSGDQGGGGSSGGGGLLGTVGGVLGGVTGGLGGLLGG